MTRSPTLPSRLHRLGRELLTARTGYGAQWPRRRHDQERVAGDPVEILSCGIHLIIKPPFRELDEFCDIGLASWRALREMEVPVTDSAYLRHQPLRFGAAVQYYFDDGRPFPSPSVGDERGAVRGALDQSGRGPIFPHEQPIGRAQLIISALLPPLVEEHMIVAAKDSTPGSR